MKTTLCKTDREEIKAIVEEIGSRNYVETEYLGELKSCKAFQRLQAIANQERHPEGDQSNLKNESSVSWERLLSMRDEALSFHNPTFKDVAKLLDEEIKRRLLMFITPKN